VSSLKLPALFDPLAQPLHYAEALLAEFAQLARLRNSRQLQDHLVTAVAELTGCPLCQLYLLDATHTRLLLAANWLDGQLNAVDSGNLSSDYNEEQLLQYSLCQNEVLNIPNLDSSTCDTSFLPSLGGNWRSLLCLPIRDGQEHISGLLLIASHAATDLQCFAHSLRLLGDFSSAQIQMLNQLHVGQQPANEPLPASTGNSRGYGLIGDSEAMQGVYQLIGKVLHNPVTVLLTGESGTGKELVAKAIHDYGSRRTKPLIVQNCAALPESLLESELFGYRKGAFTGAEQDRKGLLDAANGGTLFLDEIGDMPLSLQAKLLRVLQEGEVRPLGSNETHKVDVRIIAATHQDLHEMVRAGQFREDLYYRLSHFPIELPPLRERGDDIQLLARRFVEDACCFLQRETCYWAEGTLELLSSYHFPGNVRELKGMIARAMLLCDGNLLLQEHFNLPKDSQAGPSLSLRERLERVERNLLLDSLQRNQGNQTLAATELGLPRRTLLYRMQRLNINPAEAKARDKNNAQNSH